MQYLHELPEEISIKIIQVITYSGWCRSCGHVRSTAPDQLSRAGGCARTQIGRRAVAFAARLKFGLGMTYRKVCEVLDFFGLSITPGGLVQAFHRMALEMIGVWLQIFKRIRAGPLVHADETSWYVGEPGWWLWVFCNRQCTMYSVAPSRGSDVVERNLGKKYAGVLVTDCLSSYDPIQCAKQKCIAHHKGALSDAIKRLPDSVTEPLKSLKRLLSAALGLARARKDMSSEKFQHYFRNLKDAVNRILDKDYEHEGVGKALHRFRNYRKSLFTFLKAPAVPATNNLAERQLRPGVISRKLSCGNRTDKGRRTWQILTSIAATCQQQDRSFTALVAQTLPLKASTPQLFNREG